MKTISSILLAYFWFIYFDVITFSKGKCICNKNVNTLLNTLIYESIIPILALSIIKITSIKTLLTSPHAMITTSNTLLTYHENVSIAGLSILTNESFIDNWFLWIPGGSCPHWTAWGDSWWTAWSGQTLFLCHQSSFNLA